MNCLLLDSRPGTEPSSVGGLPRVATVVSSPTTPGKEKHVRPRARRNLARHGVVPPQQRGWVQSPQDRESQPMQSVLRKRQRRHHGCWHFAELVGIKLSIPERLGQQDATTHGLLDVM